MTDTRSNSGANSTDIRVIHVQVTQADIDEGVPCDACQCPVALALWRATGEKWIVDVDECHRLGNSTHMAPLDASVRTWIKRFDDGWLGLVRPIEFDLRVQEQE